MITNSIPFEHAGEEGGRERVRSEKHVYSKSKDKGHGKARAPRAS